MFTSNRLPLQFKLVTLSLIIPGSIALWIMAHTVSQGILTPNINILHVVGLFYILALFIGLGLLSLRPRSRTFALFFVRTERTAIGLILPSALLLIGMHNQICSIYPSSCDFLGTVIEILTLHPVMLLPFMIIVALSRTKVEWQVRVLGKYHHLFLKNHA